MLDCHDAKHSSHNRAQGGGVNPPLHYAIPGIALVLALIGWISGVTLVVHSQAGTERSQRTLTLEDRVGYQRAIEAVYWQHRIWPTENRQAKPTLDEVMPPSAIQAKVEDYLRKSQALEAYWQRPITGKQLQAEMDRMARQTKQPGILQGLWAALGNDPYVIAECLARPSLANRLIRNWYAHDERYHGELKRRAEADLQAYGTVSQMREMSGEYREVEWTKTLNSQPFSQSESVAVRPGEKTNTVALNSNEWKTKVRELAALFSRGKEMAVQPDVAAGLSHQAILDPGAIGEVPSGEVDFLPVGELSGLQEDEEQFYVTAVLDKGNRQVRVAMVEWKKQPFENWWKGAASQGQIEEPSYPYRLPAIASESGACVDDTWQPTLAPAISARTQHTAVWTGSEMIVWGGHDSFSSAGTGVNTGGRYNPATDSWTATSTNNAPIGRIYHTAVWTGSQMIVWGGLGYDPFLTNLNTGGRYNPATDSWTATNTVNAPTAPSGHTAVWTGSQMIVWGGSFPANTGGRYNPATDSWTATSTNNAPSARDGHTAVWAGSQMIIWGGGTGLPFNNTGGRYNPATDSWTATNTVNAPTARSGHTAVWTGSQMIVWGGESSQAQAPLLTTTGGRYDPATDTWIATATGTNNVPDRRAGHTAVWTGSEMIVWGGMGYNPFVALTDLNTGGRYDPATDSWSATNTVNAPTARSGHTAVWTGSQMIVWGGGESGVVGTGGRYDPATDSWSATSASNAPFVRSGHTAVWTGSQMIVWGGAYPGSPPTNTGGRYDPATDSWSATSTSNAPSARDGHTAVWTGSQMIVWGGGDGGVVGTGGRYDPATDSWSTTSTSNGPTGRIFHTAVWTGSQMIIWGGSYLNTGGRYNPATDSWTATSTNNAPTRRIFHTAVWTGSQMIIWGGADEGPIALNTGGRYNPATDTWTATATGTKNVPDLRFGHTAVSAGSELIIWGGVDNNSLRINTGGRYCASATIVPDFSISASPSTATVTAGQSSTYTLTITPLGGFSGTVSLSCSGAPQGSPCSVPPSVTLDGTHAATATATVTTTARSKVARRLSPPDVWPLTNLGLTWLLVLLAIAILIRSGMSNVRRSRAHVGFGVAMFLIVLLLLGCASGHGAGTPPGTYTITFPATAGQLSHTASATLTVN